MASGLSKALEGFALGTLGQAAGQDFLGPALAHERSKDLFAFQRKQLEEAAAKDRQREREQRESSQRGLVNAMAATGVVTAEDLVSVGGADALAGLDRAEFQMALTGLQENRLRSLSKEERRKAVEAAALARGLISAPLDPNAADEDVLLLNERVNLWNLEREEQEENSNDNFRAQAAALDAFHDEIGAATANPLSITANTLDSLQGQLGLVQTQLTNADMKASQREALAARVPVLQKAIAAFRPQVAANMIGSLEAADQFAALAKLGREDQQGAALAKTHPGVVENLTTLRANYRTLRELREEEAEQAGVGDAWRAAQKYSAGAILSDPDAAYAVFSTNAERAKLRAEDRAKRVALESDVADMANALTSLEELGGPFAAAAEHYRDFDPSTAITGTPEAPRRDVTKILGPILSEFQTYVDRATLPGREDDLYELRATLESLKTTNPEVANRLEPMLREAELSAANRLLSEGAERPDTSQLEGRGLKKIQHGADNLLVRTEGSKSGMALNATALDQMAAGAQQVLGAELDQQRVWLDARRENIQGLEERAIQTGNDELRRTAELLGRNWAKTNAEFETRDLGTRFVNGSLRELRTAMMAGLNEEDAVARVATQLTAVVGRQFQTVDMVTTAPEAVAEAILAKKTPDGSLVDAVLAYLDTESDWLLTASEQRVNRNELRDAMRETIASWRQIQAQYPDLEEVKTRDVRRMLEQQGMGGVRADYEPVDLFTAYLAGKISR